MNDRTLKYVFLHTKSCADFDEDCFAEAAQTREAAYAFLDHAAKICEPHDGEERCYFLFGTSGAYRI